MDKQFSNFTAKAPADFRRQMIAFWMRDENLPRDAVLENYDGPEFYKLCRRLIGQTREFAPDLGYRAAIEGTLCFEVEDNNFVIPIDILSGD